MKLPPLYSRTHAGKIEVWTIEVQGDSYRTISGEVDGKMTESKWKKRKAKNEGKANATTAAEQALKEAQSKWDKKARTGYFEDKDKIDNFTFHEPMLAEKFVYDKKIKGVKTKVERELTYPIISQKKYNGTRLVLSQKGGFSREGKQYHNSQHIVDTCKALFKLHPNLVLDGEHYNHELRYMLNRLASIVSVQRKPKDITPEHRDESENTVRYYIYDGYGFTDERFGEITEDTPYPERWEALKRLIKGIKYLVMVDCDVCKDRDDVFRYYRSYVAEGYEGQMLRDMNSPYEHRRCVSLLKHKHWEEGEYRVVRVEEGEGEWQGTAKTIVCCTKDGKEFNSNILGNRPYLTEMWNRRDEIPGKMATIKYQQLSEYGIPQIPWIQVIRDYE